MKSLTLVSLLSLFVAVSSFGATHKKQVKAAKPTAQTTETIATKSGPSRFTFSPGIGVPVHFDRLGLVLHAAAMTQFNASSPLYVGAETGLNLFAASNYGSYYRSNENVVDLPLLAFAQYRFTGTAKWHPYVGLGTGVHFALAGGEGYAFEIAARPGVLWDFTHSMALQGEARVGLLGGRFLLEPLVSGVWAL